MTPVRILGVDWHGLRALLAARGLVAADAPAGVGGGVTLAAEGREAAGPVVVEVADRSGASAALDRGADDAVCRADPDELVAARLAALARRATPIRVGDLLVDEGRRLAVRAGRPLPLLPREYALLAHLARAGGATVPRAELLAAVWGLAFDPGTNVVAVHASRLRAKLGAGGAAPMLETVRGRGYRLVPGAEAG